MGLVTDFQRDLLQSNKSTTELLRTAKVISSKLGLSDITAWIASEQNGYQPGTATPPYRFFTGGELQVRNPVRGWQPVTEVAERFDCRMPVAEMEELSKVEVISMPLSGDARAPLTDKYGLNINSWQQQIVLQVTQLKVMLSAIRDKLLDWALELEQRGILGENMSFNEAEIKSAHTHVFNIYGDGNTVGSGNRANVKKK